MTDYLIVWGQDEDADSPAGWDEPLSLHVAPKGGTSGDWLKRWAGTVDPSFLYCQVCDWSVFEHWTVDPNTTNPDEWAEVVGYEPHDWTPDPAVYAFVVVEDERYGRSMTVVDASELWKDRDRYENYLSTYYRRDDYLGALVADRTDPTTVEWLTSLPDDDPTAPYDRARLVDSIVSEWNVYLRGDVWQYIVREGRPECDECGREADWGGDVEDSLGGIYGEDDNDIARVAYVLDNMGGGEEGSRYFIRAEWERDWEAVEVTKAEVDAYRERMRVKYATVTEGVTQ